MSETISPNRSELLRLKGKISMAKKGHSLLKKKRDGLVMDFFKLLENAKDLRSEMIETFKQAKKSLTKTRILTFDLELKLYSKTTKGRNLVDFQSKNIMGLTVPEIKSEFAKRDLIERQKTIYSSYTMDETISKYEDLVKQIIVVAEVETAMIRLLKEIEKTKRRVNGLEFNILPKLEQQESYVKLTLQEQERDAIIALKKIKAKIDAKSN
ncbi:MAG: V-type ATP synthase subunit D [Nanoarchaeota archaeon]|nr:V-type ATP synthase subunit D [Nanoarchaeota archaeon]